MKRITVFIFAVFFIVSSCDTTINTKSGEGRVMPNVTGGAGEVLVVMDKYLWDGQPGEVLKDILKEEFPALPQSEPLFSVAQISSSSFENANRFHRSVIVATIRKNAEEGIRYRKDVWSKPQIVVQIQAPSAKELTALLDQNKKKIQDFLVRYDRDRLIESYEETQDPEMQKIIARDHHISLTIPRGYNLDLSTDSYTSISIEAADYSQVLQVYEYPATENDLSTEKLLQKRNEFTKKYVKGPQEGSYMIVESIYPPVVYDIIKDSTELVEIRSLWELEGGVMGGPFISHSVYDAKRNRIVVVDGYIYYPNMKKRTKIRQLEAIIYSMKLL